MVNGRKHLSYDNGTLVAQCVECKQEVRQSVSQAQLKAWIDGALIQRVMPEVRDREVIISGTCDSCFDKLFGDDE